MKLNPNQLAVLTAARALIYKPDAWTKGVEATDVRGCQEFATSDKAVCFCSVGAVVRASLDLGLAREGEVDANVDPEYERAEYRALLGAMQEIKEHHGLSETTYSLVADWNDHPKTTHPEVLAAFDLAIARAQ